jgi:hypothetical protein
MLNTLALRCIHLSSKAQFVTKAKLITTITITIIIINHPQLLHWLSNL